MPAESVSLANLPGKIVRTTEAGRSEASHLGDFTGDERGTFRRLMAYIYWDRGILTKQVTLLEAVMGGMKRRDAVKHLAGLAVLGTGSVIVVPATAAEGEQQQKKVPQDPILKTAVASPQAFMLSEPVSFTIEGDGRSRDLIVISSLNEDGKQIPVRVPSGTMRVFRADASVDDFTKQGGVYWKFYNTSGKVQLSTPDAIVMILREGNDTVHCYEMTVDLRC
jgi:hypothetical protein